MALESLCQLRPAKEFQPCKATQFSGNVLLRPSDSERRENEFAIYIHSVPFAGTDWSEQLEGRKALEDDLKRENPSNLLQMRRRTEHGRSNHNDGDRHGCRTNYFNSFVKDGKKGDLAQFPWEINWPSEGVQSSSRTRNSATLRPLKVEAGINGLHPTSWVPSIYSVSLLIRLRYALER